MEAFEDVDKAGDAVLPGFFGTPRNPGVPSRDPRAAAASLKYNSGRLCSMETVQQGAEHRTIETVLWWVLIFPPPLDVSL